jgi:hypothetical protein
VVVVVVGLILNRPGYLADSHDPVISQNSKVLTFLGHFRNRTEAARQAYDSGSPMINVRWPDPLWVEAERLRSMRFGSFLLPDPKIVGPDALLWVRRFFAALAGALVLSQIDRRSPKLLQFRRHGSSSSTCRPGAGGVEPRLRC